MDPLSISDEKLGVDQSVGEWNSDDDGDNKFEDADSDVDRNELDPSPKARSEEIVVVSIGNSLYDGFEWDDENLFRTSFQIPEVYIKVENGCDVDDDLCNVKLILKAFRT